LIAMMPRPRTIHDWRKHEAELNRYPRFLCAVDGVDVPTGVAVFPAEPWQAPRHWTESRHNIQRWTEMPRGGHFAALGQPDLLLEDVRAFFAANRQWASGAHTGWPPH
jgi:hypothetical protein